MLWYQRERKELKAIAGDDADQLAGIIAALSPRVSWEISKRDGIRLLANPLARRITGIRANIRKARRIARGARPLDVLSGPKVRAFYRALIGDERAVCVDSHVFNAYMGVIRPTSKTPSFSGAMYRRIETEIQKRADAVGISPAEYQAIMWKRQRERVKRNGGMK